MFGETICKIAPAPVSSEEIRLINFKIPIHASAPKLVKLADRLYFLNPLKTSNPPRPLVSVPTIPIVGVKGLPFVFVIISTALFIAVLLLPLDVYPVVAVLTTFRVGLIFDAIPVVSSVTSA